MEQLTYEQELWKIAFEKGLLALILIIAGFALNRYLEKFKSSLSWGAEVLKAKLDEAKAVMSELTELKDAHLHLANTAITFGAISSTDFERFGKALKALEHRLTEARLVFAGETVKAIGDVHSAAFDTFQRLSQREHPGRPGPVPDLTPKRRQELQNEGNALRSQISHAIDSLRVELNLTEYKQS